MIEFNNKNGPASSFIVECFEEFYKQVLKYKKFALSMPWQAGEGEEATSSPNATAQYILSQLQTFLEEQSVSAGYGGDSFTKSFYAEAQFIMVALADETFLNLDWSGKHYWESNLLESRLYNTHSAGQTFFDKLDALLQNKDPVHIDLAVLYLNALALGFQGKYRHFDDNGALASYRKRLFVFINRREPYLFQKKIYLFPDSYAHTLEGGVAKELPNMRNWLFVLMGLIVTYLIFSYIIWYNATSDISQIVNRIITYSNMSG